MATIGQSARLTSLNVQVMDRSKLAVGKAKSQEERQPYPTTEFDGGKGNLLRSLESGSRQRALGESEELAENTTKSEAANNSGSDNALDVSVIALAAVKTAIDTDSSGIQATDSAVATDSSGIETAKAAMKQNLTQLASDPQAFHAVMKANFGESYDQAKAETIRQQVLAGDFS